MTQVEVTRMTQLEVIRMIGDVITEIDVTIGSLRPSDPNLLRLQDQRRLLDSRQLELSRQLFDDNTETFQNAASTLKAVNDEIVDTLDDIDHLNQVIANVTRFLNAVTSLMTTIGGL